MRVFHYSGHGSYVADLSGDEPDESDECLVPFVKATVPEVDLRAGVVVIDPPPGLLDPAQAQ